MRKELGGKERALDLPANPERQHLLTPTVRELNRYRKAKTLDELTDIDRVFFERHPTASVLERPLFALDIPQGVYPALPGKIHVYWLADGVRMRLPAPELTQN